MVKTSSLPQISISWLAAEYGATEFLPALKTFLKDHIPANRLKLSTFDQFDPFKLISILLPSKPHSVMQNDTLQSVQHFNPSENGL